MSEWPEGRIRLDRRHELALAALVAAVGGFAVAQSWNRWVDPIIDAFDLYIGDALAHGLVLYRDIHYSFLPLAPYTVATLVSIAGSRIPVFVAFGIVTAIATAAAMWMCARAVAGPIAAFAAVLLFAAYSVAGPSGWGNNFVIPYTHSATVGMLMFACAAACAATYLFVRSDAMLGVAATTFAVLASFTKLEFVLCAAVLMAVFALVHRRFRYGAAYAAAGAVVLVAAAAYFGVATFRANVLPQLLLHGRSSSYFYDQVSGLAVWRRNVAEALRGLLLIAAMATAIAAVSRAQAWRQRLLPLAAIAAVSWLLADETFFLAWTPIQIGLIPFALRRPRAPLLLLLACSGTASLRIYLNLVPYWYGFVLMVPVYVLIAFVLFEWLPQQRAYTRTAGLLWLPLFALLSISALAAAHRAYSVRQTPIVSARGILLDAPPERAAIVNELLQHLARAHARSLVVMPEGLTLNFLAGVRTPLSYYLLTPIEIDAPAIEIEIVKQLRVRRPEYVAIVPRDVRGFGYTGFGKDYGLRITRALRANYVLEAQWRGRDFYVVLLKLRR